MKVKLPKLYSEAPEMADRVSGGSRTMNSTFKERMAYARAVRRGSRSNVTAEVFKASVAEAIKVIPERPAAKIEHLKVTLEALK